MNLFFLVIALAANQPGLAGQLQCLSPSLLVQRAYPGENLWKLKDLGFNCCNSHKVNVGGVDSSFLHESDGRLLTVWHDFHAEKFSVWSSRAMLCLGKPDATDGEFDWNATAERPFVVRAIDMGYPAVIFSLPSTRPALNWKVLSKKSSAQELERECHEIGERWRLPTIPELLWLSANKNQGDAVFADKGVYVSANTKSTDIVFLLDLEDRRVGWATNDFTGFAICVEGAELDRSLIPLTWDAHTTDKVDWSKAESACIAEKRRLPTAAELWALFGTKRIPPPAPTELRGNGFWSAETKDGKAWAVEFKHGSVQLVDKSITTNYLCVPARP